MPLFLPAKDSGKVSFSPKLMRKQAETVFHTVSRILDPIRSRRTEAGVGKLFYGKIPVTVEEGRNDPFVLLGGEGTGGVDESPTGG
jgi:hypothetical protein